MTNNKIEIYKFISSNDAETPDQGDLVYKSILPIIEDYINKEERFNFDFTNIKNITTAFLNNCIGKLFFELDGKKLEKLMTFSGFSNKAQIKVLRHSISNAISLSKIK